ncbi:MAG: hypothetical protein R3C26_26450 [Calditrichia bacterium]
MKHPLLLICLILSIPLFGEESKPDYSKLGLKAGLKLSLTYRIFTEPALFERRLSSFTLTPNYTIWPFKENKVWGETGISVGYIGVYDFISALRIPVRLPENKIP